MSKTTITMEKSASLAIIVRAVDTDEAEDTALLRIAVGGPRQQEEVEIEIPGAYLAHLASSLAEATAKTLEVKGSLDIERQYMDAARAENEEG